MDYSINGLNAIELEEASRAVAALRERESKNTPPNPAPADAQQPHQPSDEATAERAERIFQGLTWAPLGADYDSILQGLLNAPSGQFVTLAQLLTATGSTRQQFQARLSKLSGRMTRIATPEESATMKTAFLLLAEIKRVGNNSKHYRLTAAGREAVARYLTR